MIPRGSKLADPGNLGNGCDISSALTAGPTPSTFCVGRFLQDIPTPSTLLWRLFFTGYHHPFHPSVEAVFYRISPPLPPFCVGRLSQDIPTVV